MLAALPNRAGLFGQLLASTMSSMPCTFWKQNESLRSITAKDPASTLASKAPDTLSFDFLKAWVRGK
jgi:hypothetical protein